VVLNDLPLGQAARITHVDAEGQPVMLRLMEMGLVPGASVSVRKRAPFRGPLELVVEGYLLSIRAAEAARLSVEALRTPEAEGAPSRPLARTADEAA
jgi:Fe2+ transport system protein FeoA